MVGLLNARANELEHKRLVYLQQAREDVNACRAVHNSQLKQMQCEENKAKRQVRIASLKENFLALGQRVGKMQP